MNRKNPNGHPRPVSSYLAPAYAFEHTKIAALVAERIEIGTLGIDRSKRGVTVELNAGNKLTAKVPDRCKRFD